MEIATKETYNWSSYQVKPFYYYLSFFTQSGLWTIPAFIGLLYPYLINRVNNKKVYQLSFFWTIFALLLLSVIPEKKSRYLMPVLIPLAINTGFYMYYIITKFELLKRKVETTPVYLNFGLLGAFGVLSPIIAYFQFSDKLNDHLSTFIPVSILLFAIGVIILKYLFKKKILQVLYFSILLFVCIMTGIVPVLIKYQNQNNIFTPITNLKGEAGKQKIEVYFLDKISPEMLWDYGTIIPKIETVNDIYKFPRANTFGLLINNKDTLYNSKISEMYHLKEVETYNRNIAEDGARRHHPRNINYYFLLTKKETKE